MEYSDADARNAGVECRRGMKKSDFRPISRFISEMTQPGPRTTIIIIILIIIIIMHDNCYRAVIVAEPLREF